MITPKFTHKINTPFAEKGDKSQIPLKGDNNTLGYDVGYPVVYEKPPLEGGQLIKRTQFNALLNTVTSALKEIQELLLSGQLTVEEANRLTKVLPISEGGTGASTREQARANLGIKDTDLSPYYNKTEVNNLLNNKANTSHSHSQYAPSYHTQDWSTITNKPTNLGGMPIPFLNSTYPITDNNNGTLTNPTYSNSYNIGAVCNYYSCVINGIMAGSDTTERNRLPNGGSWLVFLKYFNWGQSTQGREFNTVIARIPGGTLMTQYKFGLMYPIGSTTKQQVIVNSGILLHSWTAIRVA